MADRVRFLGYLPEDELESVLAATDVALCPFERMSASGALATWFSAGRPIVASDLAPFRELKAMQPGALHIFRPYEAERAGALHQRHPGRLHATIATPTWRPWRGAWPRRASSTATSGCIARRPAASRSTAQRARPARAGPRGPRP